MTVYIIFASQGGFTSNYAYQLVEKIQEAHCPDLEEDDVVAVNLAQLDDDYEALFADSGEKDLHIFLLPTYHGQAPEHAQSLQDFLEQEKSSKLSHLRFSVFGTGNATYAKEKFAAFSKAVQQKLIAKGAKEAVVSVQGDQSSDIDKQFTAWTNSIVSYLRAQN